LSWLTFELTKGRSIPDDRVRPVARVVSTARPTAPEYAMAVGRIAAALAAVLTVVAKRS